MNILETLEVSFRIIEHSLESVHSKTFSIFKFEILFFKSKIQD